jgi:integrase
MWEPSGSRQREYEEKHAMRGSIQKRGQRSWRLVFDLERDHTGRRKQKTLTFRGTKRDAEAELSRVLAEIENGGFVDAGNLTVAEFLDRWLEHVSAKTATKTHERYAEIVRLGLTPRIGSIKLAKLRPIEIQNLYAEALKSGRVHGKGGLSARSVLHYHRILNQALKMAVRWQLLPHNPADPVEPPRPEQREMVALNEDQTITLIESVKGKALYIPVLLAVTTGMRRGEVLALRWSNIDLDKATLSVTQTLEKSREGGLRFKQPKTPKSRRTISLPSITVDALRQHRIAQAQLYLRLGLGWDETGLICAKGADEPINPNTLTSGFTSHVRNMSIPRVRFHDLRHTHATQLLKEGVHPKVAQERLGHATIAVTLDLYSHVMPGMQEDAAARVDRALKSALGRRIESPI